MVFVFLLWSIGMHYIVVLGGLVFETIGFVVDWLWINYIARDAAIESLLVSLFMFVRSTKCL